MLQIDSIKIEGIEYDITVKDKTITTDKIADGAVSPEKLSNQGHLIVSYAVNKNASGGSLPSGNSNYYATTKSIIAFAKPGLTVKARLPEGWACVFYYGDYNISTESPQFTDGTEYAFGATAVFYRIKFWKTGGETITPTEVADYVASGKIDFTYISEDEDVYTRNIDKVTQVGALKRKLISTLADNGMDTLPVFAHLSDLHGDAPRLWNALEFCSRIGGVDGVLATGDFAMYQGSNFCDYQGYLASLYTFPYFFCIGNHEATTNDIAALYADNIQGLASQYGYLEAANTPTTKCYYYKDLDAKKIRIIALNYYNAANVNASLGQAQVTWFVNRLKDTPSGYGIVVLMHSPEFPMSVPEAYDKFYQYHQVSEYANQGFFVADRPIMHIVDAFIGRTTYAATYTDNGQSVTINADFSSIDPSVEFICYANGHRHRDFIGYSTLSTHMQLDLNITASTAQYGVTYPAFANEEDLPRGCEGVWQDAFNLYAIDREKKVVKVVRIGSNQNEDFKMRDYMAIPYAE